MSTTNGGGPLIATFRVTKAANNVRQNRRAGPGEGRLDAHAVRRAASGFRASAARA